MNDVQKAIRDRRSHRKFTAEPLTAEQIEALVEAAKATPTGMNLQAFHFSFVTDKDVNFHSALTLIRYGTSSAMLMADLTHGPQLEFMKLLPPEVLNVDIVKAPHHGITNFENAFLDLVAPSLVTITNRSQAKPQISSQCKYRGIPVLYSGNGDVIMETDGADWYIWQLPQQR